MGILHCIGMGVHRCGCVRSVSDTGRTAALFNVAQFSALKEKSLPTVLQLNRVDRPLEPALADADAVRFAITLTASRRPRGTRAKTTHYPVLTERII